MAKRKITVQTDNSDWQAPKKRKPRKPMTETQRAAAAKRLEKARAKRAEKNPDYGMSGVHESLLNLPDDYPLSPKVVKQWIKTQKDLMSAERAGVRQNVKGAVARLANHEGYIRNLQKYLRDGDWVLNVISVLGIPIWAVFTHKKCSTTTEDRECQKRTRN